MKNHNKQNKKTFIHIDMDSLESIYEGYGWILKHSGDKFFETSVENALSFFDDFNVQATFFVVARDLKDVNRKRLVRKVLQAGHKVASHSFNHPKLNRLKFNQKKEEIFSSKALIEDLTGEKIFGFRSPGYSIDYDVLKLLGEAGYKYDTSIFPNFKFRKQTGVNRLFPEPFVILPGQNLVEIPMPAMPFGLPPFHPCFSFVFSKTYHNFALNKFSLNHNYLTYLFHLTDFAEKPNVSETFKEKIYVNERSWRSKRRFLDSIFSKLLDIYQPFLTEDFVKDWPRSAPELNPKVVLGINPTHETSACLIKNGKLLSAVSEERLSRKKTDSAYPPKMAIKSVIKASNVKPEEIEAIAIAGLNWRDLLSQSFESQKNDFFEYHGWNDYFPHLNKFLYRVYYLYRAIGYHKVLKHLKAEYAINAKVFHVEHHEAHAWSAYANSGQNSTYVITADGVGDDISFTINFAQDGLVNRVYSQYYPHSFGQFYTAITQLLGFKGGRHEGKITGLASYGEAKEDLINSVRATFFNSNGFRLNKKFYSEGIIRKPKIFSMVFKKKYRNFLSGLGSDELPFEYRIYKPPLKRLLKNFKKQDLAFTYQSILEQEMLNLTNEYIDTKKLNSLCLAGGVFANVKLNQALSRGLDAKSLFVFPNMGDGGLSVGAAQAVLGTKSKSLQSAYLGEKFSNKEILVHLEKNNGILSWYKPKNIAKAAASLLANYKILARFEGRMEFGPRALGNRSILFNCSDPSANDWLNKQLNRTEFMPFAPLCLYEDADQYFEINQGEKIACKFMTLVVGATQKMKQLCPAAVHVDGTCRPQLVNKSSNPRLHQILQEYKKITGISCIINTSFNMHEEPIVHSPENAIKAFLGAKLDCLIAGDFIISRS